MDGICRDCFGTGIIKSDDLQVAPITCGCKSGRDLARLDIEVRIPSAQLEEFEMDRHRDKMLAEGRRECGGNVHCTSWITAEEDMCHLCLADRGLGKRKDIAE